MTGARYRIEQRRHGWSLVNHSGEPYFPLGLNHVAEVLQEIEDPDQRRHFAAVTLERLQAMRFTSNAVRRTS